MRLEKSCKYCFTILTSLTPRTSTQMKTPRKKIKKNVLLYTSIIERTQKPSILQGQEKNVFTVTLFYGAGPKVSYSKIQSTNMFGDESYLKSMKLKSRKETEKMQPTYNFYNNIFSVKLP